MHTEPVNGIDKTLKNIEGGIYNPILEYVSVLCSSPLSISPGLEGRDAYGQPLEHVSVVFFLPDNDIDLLVYHRFCLR